MVPSRSTLAFVLGIGFAICAAVPWHARDSVHAAALPPESATLRLSPQDTTLNLNATNYSADTIVATYTWPDYKIANAVLMTFDLSTLPAGVFVTEATLNLALVESDATADPTYTVSVHKILGKHPVVTGASGQTADGITSWSANACCNGGVPMAQADISPAYGVNAIDKVPGFKTWNMTTMVQEWLANPASNDGVLLNSDSSTLKDRFRFFASMQNPNASLRPFLEVTFTAPDVTPPTVVITAPAPGALSAATMLTADATDAVRVDSVQFQLDGAPLGGELVTPPYVLPWDSAAVADGVHTLAAVARDWAGNVGTSASVSVTTHNGVFLLSPEDTFLNTNATNYAGNTLLRTYTWPDYKVANAILMKFDLSAIPGVVTSATLHLAVVESDAAADPSYSIGAHKVLHFNPVISAATGRTADGVVNWTPSACCSGGVPVAQADLSAAYDVQVIGQTLAPAAWTITGLVQQWMADPASNFGLLLNSDASKPKDRYRSFASMEHADANLRPYLRVTVSLDEAPPSVSIASPVSGSAVSGTTSVSATATDNVGVAGVQFKVNGTNLGAEDTVAPYSITWNTTTVTNGSHALTAVARDAAGNATTSTAVTVTVANDVTPPVITAVTALSITTSGATIAWTTNEPANSQVDFGLTTAYGGTSAIDSALVTSHATTIGGLVGTALHHFRVRSRDAAGNLAISPDFSFITLDGTAPSVSITAPAAAATVSGTISVTSSASDNVGVAGVQFKVNGTNLGAEDTVAPYAVSWITTTLANGAHTLTAIARDAAGNQTTSVAISVTVSNAPPPAGSLAALYPGDVGIESHPDVVLVERFEDAALTSVFPRWSDVLNGSTMSLATDVPSGSTGARSLNIPWTGGGVSNGGHLYKQLAAGVDTLYVRYYIKYPTSGAYDHTGIWLGGSNPASPWPNPQAGIKPVGNDRFIAAAEQHFATSRFDHYNYWMNMHQSADGNYWGNLLLNNPAVQATPGQWMCVEHMVKLNSPTTASNGEHAIWLNGVKVSHLGPSFPNGSWSGGIFTQSAGGSPFGGFRWRSNSALKINWIWLQVYAPDAAAGVNSAVKFDHVVAARSYVGCLSGVADGVPPTVSMSSPSAGATVSGTITPSATASDNIGVTGVQFKLDGVNLGAEDTAAPFSTSWNTTGAANGTHTLTAVARDLAGNTSTSAAVTITVSNIVNPAAWPNEPAGMTLVTDWGLDQVLPTSGDVPLPGSGGWKVVQNATPGSAQGWAERVFDASAPASSPNVYDFVYPAGMVEGEAPAAVYYDGLAATEVYVGFWWKASAPFDVGPNGNKIAFVFNGGGATGGQQFLILHTDHRLHILPEYPGDYTWRTPNVNATVVTLGAWHRIEWYTNRSTGVLKWWLDGLLQGSYTNVTNPVAFDMFQFNPTFGGNNGAHKAQTDHYWFDHAHLSKR